MEKRALLFVQLRVDPEKEEEFNEWYRDYLDTLLPLAPTFTTVRRFVSRDAEQTTYLTIYESEDVEALEEAMAAFDLPERQTHRVEWKAWESSSLEDVSAGVFEQVYP
jgi:antibiotic biosynthesis monooxygenase (ABM) superfamily enzyme